MSASKDRINRKQQIEAGTDKRTKAAAEEAAKRRKTNITYIVVAAILVVFFAFIFLYNSTLPVRTTTAVTIDGEDYTAAQVNYYYSTSYMNFYNTYGSYISYGLFFDSSQSLKDQMYSEDMSWREYFLESAVDSMTQIHVLNKAAEEAGFTLSEEEEAEYAATIDQIENGWADLGYSNLEQYLNLNYGKGVTMDVLKEELYRTYVASAYSQSVFDSYEYSTDELDAYYAENADDLDSINYAYYTDYDGAMDTDAIAAAVNGTDEETFTSYMEENFEDAVPVSTTYQGADLNETYAEWLLDSARAAGDAAAFEDEDGVRTVVMFLGRDNNDYHPVDFRHILVMAQDADGDGAISEDEMAAAAASVEEIYTEWQAGDATEDSFAELANTYSEDTGSNTTGGLYETVSQGMMVEPINDWLFDEARQPGDTEVIEYNDASNYSGVHVVYFVGQDDMTYAEAIADNTMRNDAYNEWMTSLTDAAEVVTHSLSLCGKNH